MGDKYVDKINIPGISDTIHLVDTVSGYTKNVGTITDVKVDGTSVVSSGVASLATSSANPYNASSNKLATMADISSAGGGTVTSVGLTNATNGGLTISGSPVTGSGSITVGHSNVLASAQTTSAVYPIKIDKNGHISEYGSAVTIPAEVTESTVSGWGFTKNVGTVTDVKINNTSITSSGVANFVTNTAYNSTSNKIATMSDLPSVPNITYGTSDPSGGSSGDIYIKYEA